MIYLTIVTKTGLERRTFHALDQAQNYIDSKKDVVTFRCEQRAAPRKARKELK